DGPGNASATRARSNGAIRWSLLENQASRERKRPEEGSPVAYAPGSPDCFPPIMVEETSAAIKSLIAKEHANARLADPLSVRRRRRRLAKSRGRTSEECPASDARFRPRRRGLLLSRRQNHHLPGRGKRGRQPLLSNLRAGPGNRPSAPRQSGRWQDHLLLLLTRRQEDHLRQQPSRSRGEKTVRRGVPAARRRSQSGQATPL